MFVCLFVASPNSEDEDEDDEESDDQEKKKISAPVWNHVIPSIHFQQLNLISIYACMACRARSHGKAAIRFPDGTEFVTIVQCPACIWKNRNLAGVVSGFRPTKQYHRK